MSLTLPERWDSALIVGRTPWGVPSGPRDALVPLLPRRIRHLRSLRSRPGGRLRTRASAPPSDADGWTWQSKWHWDAILPHKCTPCIEYTYAQIPAVLRMKRAGLHFQVAPP
jgi:hypothetical protein